MQHVRHLDRSPSRQAAAAAAAAVAAKAADDEMSDACRCIAVRTWLVQSGKAVVFGGKWRVSEFF